MRRAVLGALLLLFCTACFDIEYRGRVYSGGAVRAEVVFVLPPLPEPGWEGEIYGQGITSYTAVLERNQVSFRADPKRKNTYFVRTENPARLSLPWLVLNYHEPSPSTFAYAHGISFPARILKGLRHTWEERLRTLESPDRDPRALAQGMLGAGKVLVRWTFPGTVTETNGFRLNTRTVQWELKGEELETRGFQMGYAFGKIPWYRRLWDRVLLFFLRIFSFL